MKQSQGIITLPSIILFNEMEVEIDEVLKSCAILFDNIKLVTAGIKGGVVGKNKKKSQIEGAILNLAKDKEFVNSNNFKEIFQYDKDFDFHISGSINPKNESGLINQTNQSKFDEIIDKIVMDLEGKSEFKSEVQKSLIVNFYKDLMSNNYSIYQKLTKQHPEFSSVINPIFRNLVAEIFNRTLPSPKEVIKEIEDIYLIDLTQFTWDEIVELRKSEFASDFRIKMAELIESYSNLIEREKLNEKLNKFIVESNFKFIAQNRPNLKRTVLRGIAGNLPIPDILNPIAVYDTVDAIDKQKYLKNKFGWLYFIQETAFIKKNQKEIK